MEYPKRAAQASMRGAPSGAIPRAVRPRACTPQRIDGGSRRIGGLLFGLSCEGALRFASTEADGLREGSTNVMDSEESAGTADDESARRRSDVRRSPIAIVQRPAGPARRIIADLAVLNLVVAVVLVVRFELTPGTIRVPFRYGGDSLFSARMAKAIIETGWVQQTDRLGAPFGQVLYDFPLGGDNANYLVMRLLAAFTGNWVLVVNVFFLFSFFAAATSAYLCQRWLRVGRTAALVTSVLFAFAPYHFVRGTNHLLLASYFVVPISVLLAVRASTWGVPEPGPSDALDRARRWTPWLALCVLAGSCGAYYAVFGVLVVMVMCCFSAAAWRTWRPLVVGAAFATTTGITFLLNISGSILYQRRHGPNPAVAARSPLELDVYALRPVQLLTPVPGHWIGALRSVTADLSLGAQPAYTQFLGLAGGAAFVAMLGWMALSLMRAVSEPVEARPLLAAASLTLVMIGVSGGLSWFFTLAGFTEIRAWDRVSIVILFMSLCWSALAVGPFARRWIARRPRRRPAAFVLAALIAAFGIADQASIDDGPPLRSWDAPFESDRAFFAAVESQMAPAAAVYVLPYRRFPEESPAYLSADYDLLRPYLNTQHMRWSYGGMKGRDADWEEQLAGFSSDELVTSVLAVGFDGILIDRFGYPDMGELLKAELIETTQVTPSLSSDQRWYFFDISGSRGRYEVDELEERGEELLHQPRVGLAGCGDEEGEGEAAYRWCGRDIRATVSATEATTGTFFYEFGVTAPGGDGILEIVVDGVAGEYPVGPTLTPISIDLPSSDAIIEISADVPAVQAVGDPRELRIQIFSPAVVRPVP
jgi:hypothetical protein